MGGLFQVGPFSHAFNITSLACEAMVIHIFLILVFTTRRSAKMSAREELPPSKLEQCASQPPYQANSRSSYHNGLV